jgi:hypothetical protein
MEASGSMSALANSFEAEFLEIERKYANEHLDAVKKLYNVISKASKDYDGYCGLTVVKTVIICLFML